MRFRGALLAIVSIWLALRIVYWNGYYTEDSPGYVTDAIWAVLGNYHARSHVNGLNVGTYLPVALPILFLGKSELALALWPLACSLLGLLSIAGVTGILFGRPASLLAAFLYATYPGDVFFSTVVMPDALQSGWITFSMFLIVASYFRRPRVEGHGSGLRLRLMLACAGIAMGVCHLIRANDVLLVPAGVLAVMTTAAISARRRWWAVLSDGGAYVGGYALVVASEGLAYLWATGDFLLRLHVVTRHYGTVDSIARAGLNTDPRTIPLSLFAPVDWWMRGGWGHLNQDQAYHALMFCWAVVGLAIGAVALVVLRERADPRARAGLAVAAVWFLWPLLYHEFGTQSLTQFVPMHRLSRHLVVYAPGAMIAITAGCYFAAAAVASAGNAVRVAAMSIGAVAIVVHAGFNWMGERISYGAFHRIKDTYVRIRQRLPEPTRAIVADPGDLCFFDFWMNPIGSERVRMIPFAAYQSCQQMKEGVVLTQSNPGWLGGAPIIQETVDRLPCLVHPPVRWRLVYQGYPERVFEITTREGHARN